MRFVSRKGGGVRRAMMAGAAVAMCLALQPCGPAQAQQASYSIAPQPLGPALTSFADRAGLRLLFPTGLVAGRTTQGVSGSYTAEQALARLLAGTGLTYVFTSPRTVTIGDPAAAAGVSGLDGAIAIEAIDVEGASGGDGTVGYVASRATAGTKTDTPIIETPQSISVVTRDQIEATGARRLEETLSYTPGVQTNSYGSNPEQDYVFLRGFQAPLAVNGIKEYKDYIVGAQPGFEPYGFERIEVLRGPSSVLYGQISPGGLVNQVLKAPTEEPFREIQLQVGSPNRVQMAFDLSGSGNEDGTFLYRITGLGRLADGQMDFQDDDRAYLAPSFTWKPNQDTHFTLFLQAQADRGQLRPVPLPPEGTIFPNPNGEIPRDRFLGEPSFDSFERDQFAVGYEFEHRFDDVFTIRQNLRFSHTEQTENFTLPYYNTGPWNDPADPGYLTEFAREPWHDVNTIDMFGVDTHLQAEFDTGPLTHTLVFGVDYRHVESDWQFEYGTLADGNAHDPVYGILVTGMTPFFDQMAIDDQVGLYVQDQIAIDRWRFVGGVRHDWANSALDEKLWTQTKYEQEDTAVTGRVGAAYLFDSGFAPYASYSTSFDPYGIDAYGWFPMEPSTAEQYEVGVKYQPPGIDAFIAVSLFDLTRENVVAFDSTFTARQIGEVKVRGLEIEGKVSLFHGWDAVVAYTYLDSEITESAKLSEVGKPLFLTPEHQFALWGNYTFDSGALAGLGLGAGVRYRGEIWGSSHEIKVPSHVLFDAAVSYDFGAKQPDLEGLELKVAARNLFDEEYIATCSYWEGCFYGDGRTVTATMTYRW